MKYFFLVLYLVSVRAISQEIFVQDISKSSELLYYKPKNLERGEYAEGDLFAFDLNNNRERLLVKDVLVEYTIARWVGNDTILVFTLSSIFVLDKNGTELQSFAFGENELLRGVEYDRTKNSAMFLLETKGLGMRKISLCSFDVGNLELKKLRENLNLKERYVENLPYKLSFLNPGVLLINDIAENFLIFNLKDKLMEGITLGFIPSYNNSVDYVVTPGSIIYYQYLNKVKSKYTIWEYSVKNKSTTQLLTGKGKLDRPVDIRLFACSNDRKLIIQIDKGFYLYDYKDFKKLKMGDAAMGLIFDGQFFYYTNGSQEIRRIAF